MTPASATPRPATDRARQAPAAVLALGLSPYHLCTREAPAMLALTLGASIVTLLPEPPAGDSREAVKDAAHLAPRFLRLLDSWKWSAPMWDQHILSAGVGDDRALHRLGPVYSDIRQRSSLAPLRALTADADQRRSREPIKALDALCSDLMRGGPDPGINIPVTAALDRLCVEHALPVVRSAATSVAQRAEMLMARKLFAFSIPLLLRAGGLRVLTLRRDLATELDVLRSALLAALPSARVRKQGVSAHAVSISEPLADSEAPAISSFVPDPAKVQALSAAARTFARAFDSWSVLGAVGDDENSQRVVPGWVSVSAVALPHDAALRAGQAAARSMSSSSSGGSMDADPATGPLIALIVREMNARPE